MSERASSRSTARFPSLRSSVRSLVGSPMSERSLVPAAEVALALITLGAVLGMGRLFAGGDWIAPLAINAVVAHGTAVVLRRGRALGLAAIVMAIAAALVVTWTCYWATTTLGIPTGDTLSLVRHDLPTPGRVPGRQGARGALTGFVVASALAIWCIAYVADWAAFRLWVPFESTFPAGTLFLFTALLGTDRGQALVRGRVRGDAPRLPPPAPAGPPGGHHPLGGGTPSGRPPLAAHRRGRARHGRGPRRGRDRSAAPRGRCRRRARPERPQRRRAAAGHHQPAGRHPGRLVQQANVEVFTVRSTARAYWRLTSLEKFDGRDLVVERQLRQGRRLARPRPSTPTAHRDGRAGVLHRGARCDLVADRLRAPVVLRTTDLDARYDEHSSTLIVEQPGDRTATASPTRSSSTSPASRPRTSTGTRGGDPERHPQRSTSLPDGFSPRVAQLADGHHRRRRHAVRQGAGPPGLLPETFTYDLAVAAGPRRQRARALPVRDRARATASSSPARSRRWPARSGSRPGWRWASRPAWPTRGARPVPGAGRARPRLARGVLRRRRAGWRSSRRRVAACPPPSRTPGCPSSRRPAASRAPPPRSPPPRRQHRHGQPGHRSGRARPGARASAGGAGRGGGGGRQSLVERYLVIPPGGCCRPRRARGPLPGGRAGRARRPPARRRRRGPRRRQRIALAWVEAMEDAAWSGSTSARATRTPSAPTVGRALPRPPTARWCWPRRRDGRLLPGRRHRGGGAGRHRRRRADRGGRPVAGRPSRRCSGAGSTPGRAAGLATRAGAPAAGRSHRGHGRLRQRRPLLHVGAGD